MDLDAEGLVASLRSKGLRITAARRAVCRVVAAAHDEHLSAAEVHARAERSAGTRIDPSTVYRTLETLENLGMIHHVHLGHGAGVVHVADHDVHHHLVCDECGATVDVPFETFEPLLRRLEAEYGFEAVPGHFGINGRCASCRAALHEQTLHEQTRNNPGSGTG